MNPLLSPAPQPATSHPVPAPSFAVISGEQVRRALEGREKQIVALVEAAYRLHGAGPANVASGLHRASAVLILDDHDTGYPLACLESSIISATRTAASAALAADWLSRTRPRPTRIGFVGTGLTARYVHTFLAGTGWTFDTIGVHDVSADSATGFHGYLRRAGGHEHTGQITVHDSAEELVRSSDLVVFATIADRPHITDPGWFTHHPLVLH
ncbi:2,3-diaminopropionate biosynthesis protein SbnB, partial [Streptomyces sp. MCAF7]